MNELKIGGVYQHRKGGLYIVLAVAQSADDPSARLVVYRDEAFPKTAEAYDSWVDALPEGDAS